MRETGRKSDFKENIGLHWPVDRFFSMGETNTQFWLMKKEIFGRDHGAYRKGQSGVLSTANCLGQLGEGICF